ncbi:hypothetical protein KAFR_0L00680 [Kazachstania africana CBS 2517]|uniref:Uncharacterized protein n=1 Tax=Kazachstania africana (strain ATCC 22294 / BCRC 22015 / CBS 2517 / CECT 1963 / NBRC 1671 / NRRL Y-8276) TaxID=1071382 RepID=H2B225_KAZAF|nr:hypothetical protein KAFR_0L00680 [Kazachstania africana CBS 2517]CCF60675.1 hypothetical protein KAFR_0L00680 [Kazachstania africana CBS 2517]
MTTAERVTRLSRSRSKGAINYKERNETDFSPDIGLSDEDESVINDEVAPIWLQDDIRSDSDVDLESEEDELDGNLKNYRNLIREKNEQDSDSGDSDLDEEDSNTVSLKLKQLDEFVKQSQVYSSIIADTLLKRSSELANESTDTTTLEDAQPKKKQKTNKKKKSIMDFFKKDDGTSKTEKNTSSTPSQQTIAKEQPSLLKNCILKPYQLEGLDWLITLYENGLNGILADDMGLGKTIQSIALLAFIYEMDTKGPFLIAAPLSTVDNWMNEFARFAPDIPVLKYYHQSGAKERAKLLRKFFKQTNGAGVVITSYEIIMRDADYIISKHWNFLIVDEGHRLKNVNSKLIRELKRINTSNRLLLTGTPLQNNLAELWSLLNFIMPDIFSDFEIFNKWFDFKDLELQSSSKKLTKVINDELEKNLITNLHTILKPFLLRRLKKIVLADILPPKREYIVNCPMTKIQQKFYKNALSSKLKMTVFKEMIKQFFTLNTGQIGRVSNKSIREFIDYKLKEKSDEQVPEASEVLKNMDVLYNQHLHAEITNIRLQNMMMQLRQIVDSTYLFYFPFLEPDDLTLEMLLNTSGKLQTLQKLVVPLVDKGHKVLIFSQFVDMLDLLEDWCELNSINSFRIDGSVDNPTRKERIEQFNEKGDNHNIFLLSTRAAGLGINLTAGDTVVLFDSDWNPQVDLQAMDRCHRIGQDKPVIVYRLCCDNTIEHVILTRAANKRRLERLVIQMGRFNSLKKLALNEGSFLKQNTGIMAKTTNKQLVEELSQLLAIGQSSIGFTKPVNDVENVLTNEEVKELTDRSLKAYKPDRNIDLPHVKLFETTSGLN